MFERVFQGSSLFLSGLLNGQGPEVLVTPGAFKRKNQRTATSCGPSNAEQLFGTGLSISNTMRYRGIVSLLGIILLTAIGIFLWSETEIVPGRVIKVGILHSLTGTMAISEKSVVDATLLGIEEVNASGGLLGKRIEALVVDAESDLDKFASEAERLITQEQVQVIFGCWTSASRKMVKPIVERHNHLLFYPVQYEGLEQSANIIYTGAAPNQQIIPAVKWAFDHLGKRFYLVGSDYVFPRTANAIIKDQVKALRGQILGERYVPLGSLSVETIVSDIVDLQPDVILNSINGDTNTVFFEKLRSAGITPDRIPTLSFSLAEDELRSLKATSMAGDFAAWNYFQSIDTENNQAFIQNFQSKFGTDRVTDDPMEAAYFGVYLWAQAVRDAGTTDVQVVRRALLDQSFAAPEGIVYIDPETQHTWKTVRVGRIRPNGQFEIVWASDHPIRPVPFPSYRSPLEWEHFLNSLYSMWGDRWAAPGNGDRT